MEIADVFCYIVFAVVALFVVYILYASVSMASKWDDIEQEYWDEYWGRDVEMQEKAQKSYERYRERFARDYHLTIEEATEYQAVKNYKEYLENEYKKFGVQICEKVGDS